jgi:hypothetical protein
VSYSYVSVSRLCSLGSPLERATLVWRGVLHNVALRAGCGHSVRVCAAPSSNTNFYFLGVTVWPAHGGNGNGNTAQAFSFRCNPKLCMGKTDNKMESCWIWMSLLRERWPSVWRDGWMGMVGGLVACVRAGWRVLYRIGCWECWAGTLALRGQWLAGWCVSIVGLSVVGLHFVLN